MNPGKGLTVIGTTEVSRSNGYAFPEGKHVSINSRNVSKSQRRRDLVPKRLRPIPLILVECFLFTTLGSELAWAKPSASYPMLLRARSTAQDGGVTKGLKHSLRTGDSHRDTLTPLSTVQDGGRHIEASLATLTPADKRRIRKWWRSGRRELTSLARHGPSDRINRTVLNLMLSRNLTSADEVLFALDLLNDPESPLASALHARLSVLLPKISDTKVATRLQAMDPRQQKAVYQILLDHLLTPHEAFIKGRLEGILSRYQERFPELFNRGYAGQYRRRLNAAVGRAFAEVIIPRRSPHARTPLTDFASPWIDLYLLGEVAKMGERRLSFEVPAEKVSHKLPPLAAEKVGVLERKVRLRRASFLMEKLSVDRRAFPQLIAYSPGVLRFRKSVLEDAGLDPIRYWVLFMRPADEVVMEWKEKQIENRTRNYHSRLRKKQMRLLSGVKQLFDIDYVTRWVIRDLRDNAPHDYQAFLAEIKPSLSKKEGELLALLADPKDYGNKELAKRFINSKHSASILHLLETLFVKVRRFAVIQTEIVQVMREILAMTRDVGPRAKGEEYYLISWVVYEMGKNSPERTERIARLYPAIFGSTKIHRKDERLSVRSRIVHDLIKGTPIQKITHDMTLEAGSAGVEDVDDARDAVQGTLRDLLRLPDVEGRFIALRDLLGRPKDAQGKPWSREWTFRIRQRVRVPVLKRLTDQEFEAIVKDYPMIPAVQRRHLRGADTIVPREIAALRALRSPGEETKGTYFHHDTSRALAQLEFHPVFFEKFVEAGNRWMEEQKSHLLIYVPDRALVRHLLQELAKPPGGERSIQDIQGDYPALHARVLSRFRRVPSAMRHRKENDIPLIAHYALAGGGGRREGPALSEGENAAFAAKRRHDRRERVEGHTRVMSVLWFHPRMAERYVAWLRRRLTEGKWTLEDLYQFIRFKRLFATVYPDEKGSQTKEDALVGSVRQEFSAVDEQFKVIWDLFNHILSRYNITLSNVREDLMGGLFRRMDAETRYRIFREAKFTKAQSVSLSAAYPIGKERGPRLSEADLVTSVVVRYTRRKLEAFLIWEAIQDLNLSGQIPSPVRMGRTGAVRFARDEEISKDSLSGATSQDGSHKRPLHRDQDSILEGLDLPEVGPLRLERVPLEIGSGV